MSRFDEIEQEIAVMRHQADWYRKQAEHCKAQQRAATERLRTLYTEHRQLTGVPLPDPEKRLSAIAKLELDRVACLRTESAFTGT